MSQKNAEPPVQGDVEEDVEIRVEANEENVEVNVQVDAKQITTTTLNYRPSCPQHL